MVHRVHKSLHVKHERLKYEIHLKLTKRQKNNAIRKALTHNCYRNVGSSGKTILSRLFDVLLHCIIWSYVTFIICLIRSSLEHQHSRLRRRHLRSIGASTSRCAPAHATLDHRPSHCSACHFDGHHLPDDRSALLHL